MTRVAVAGEAGIEIAVHELGAARSSSSRTDLLLVHAAGLHGHVWLPFVERLPERFRALAVDVRGHGESGPLPEGGLGWEELAADLLALVDGLDLHRPLAVGHSSGASLLLLGEEQRSGTFAGLCCIEPIGSAVHHPPPPNPAHPLAEGARRRRDVFPSLQAAFDTYAAKPPFSSVAPQALWAYLEHGFSELAEGEGGVRLRCRPEDEAGMYTHGLSHHAYRDLDRVRCPVVLMRGDRSTVVSADVLRAWAARLPDARIEVLPGLGHFAPLEDPAAVAHAVAAAFAGE